MGIWFGLVLDCRNVPVRFSIQLGARKFGSVPGQREHVRGSGYEGA